MPARILLIDYNFDWVLRDGFLNPRTQAGFLTLEKSDEIWLHRISHGEAIF